MQRTFDEYTGQDLHTQHNNATDGARQAGLFVEMLQNYTGGPHGYRLRRIILTNFWLYGSQEFEIPHGRLFLAGENASGKSTVLLAALPLALDGDFRPHRLDTFGGRERHIDYYVLGGTESATPFSHERRTSYIALEFEWCDPYNPPIAEEIRQRWENGDRETTRFLTIGISLAGNINASDRIRPLRFLITDGSRLGYDLHTVYESSSKHEKRAYDHVHFKQQLDGHGIICDSQAEYERQVARYLFGFSDLKNFQKLINLLLVLRRPNLSSELSFSKVHDYLKQSLRKVSGETTSRVIGTIERIDAIQGEIERIQEAYKAAERLHRAQQHLALRRAQLAACEYMEAQFAEDSARSKVTKLHSTLLSTDNERRKAQELVQKLQVEQYQVNAQIATLESSEGLQVARQLTAAHERAHEARLQAQLQEQTLQAANQAEQAGIEQVERQQRRFEKLKAEAIATVNSLYTIALEECYWEVAVLQLEESRRHLERFSATAATAPEMPTSITALIGIQSEERMAWLHHLEELHQQREKREAQLENARTLENTRFQELDEARRSFQSLQDRFYDGRQRIVEALEPLVAAASAEEPEFGMATLNLAGNDDTAPASGDDESLLEKIIQQCTAALTGYRQTISQIEQQCSQSASKVQNQLNRLQQLIGAKQHEIEEVRALYEQKRSEPEFTPEHSQRRTLARAKLAEQGITAIPLYALLDFADGVDGASEEAGRVEYFLEDAGLLDALVVAPSQLAATDALLTAENLSDCRLDMSALSRDTPFEVSHNADLRRWLRFDPTITPSLPTHETEWQVTITAFLAAIPYSTHDIHTLPTFHDDGSWTHGLLTGHAGAGIARYIGRNTRLLLRKRELEALQAQQELLEADLAILSDQLTQHKQAMEALQVQQGRLRNVLPESGIEQTYSDLVHSKQQLDDARGKYQKARSQTQEARQNCNALLAQLERESKGIGPLAGSLKNTQRALLGVIKLRSQAQALQNHLASIIHSWEEHRQAGEACAQARSNKATTADLYERMRSQVLQAQAQEEELQRIAASANAEELSQRLRSLREHSVALVTELQNARTHFDRADERANNIQNNLSEAETYLQQASDERAGKQQRFVELLSSYPVEELLEAQRLAALEKHSDAAWHLLETSLREEEIALYKDRLEEGYRDAYNSLLKTFSQEQAILLEYGPDLDDQGQAHFLNEHRSRPVDLLEILSEHIEMQKTLLGQEDRLLFEDFLLQEMAEAIRTAIFEAEEWVQHINKVLSALPMIGEHYALQWKQPAEYDLSQLGSHLAQHYKLLRKPAQALTLEETETLMNAFRHEIEAVRLRQQENAGINFMDALEQVFDYREWFHFDVLVTPIGGQRQRLTDRMAGTRSGAEQLFALYVPLFAALAALYRSAAPGAPRLLALDEAFDKVSTANTQRILEFLVSQDFQWLMTGPQVSGTGARIPACARYLMIHEKGSSIATASASFWSNKQALAQPGDRQSVILQES